MDQAIIGQTAGIIWNYLNDASSGHVALGTLKKLPGVNPDAAVAAVGWLAREGKVEFQTDKKKVYVALCGARELAHT